MLAGQAPLNKEPMMASNRPSVTSAAILAVQANRRSAKLAEIHALRLGGRVPAVAPLVLAEAAAPAEEVVEDTESHLGTNNDVCQTQSDCVRQVKTSKKWLISKTQADRMHP